MSYDYDQGQRPVKFYPRTIVALTFALGLLLGVGVAYAATTTINTGQLGAGSGTVSTCDSSFDLAFGTPSYDSGTSSYVVNTVDFSNVAAGCNGQTIAVTVADGSGTALATGGATIAATSGTLTLNASISAAASATLVAAIYQ